MRERDPECSLSLFAKPFPRPEPYQPRGHGEILTDLAKLLTESVTGNEMEDWQRVANLAYEAEQWLKVNS